MSTSRPPLSDRAREAYSIGRMRSGSQYTEALRDDRCVYLGGKRVRDIVNHPAFAGAIQTVSSLYDMALDPHNEMSYAPSDAAQYAR